MACCVYFFQCSRTWLALLVPIFAVLSSSHGSFLIPITFIFLSTIFLFTFSKRKPSMQKQDSPAPAAENELSVQEKHQPTLQEKNSSSSCADFSCYDSLEAEEAAPDTREAGEEEGSQDLYSESESMEQFSSTSSSEDHSSDIEQRLDCSDGSISDEESLIEIAIPSGQFVYSDKDLMRWNVKCCKQLSQDFCKDFLNHEINEEDDNMIEIDINMGSIKC